MYKQDVLNNRKMKNYLFVLIESVKNLSNLTIKIQKEY